MVWHVSGRVHQFEGHIKGTSSGLQVHRWVELSDLTIFNRCATHVDVPLPGAGNKYYSDDWHMPH